MNTLALEIDDLLAVVMINRPDARDALSRRELAELREGASAFLEERPPAVEGV